MLWLRIVQARLRQKGNFDDHKKRLMNSATSPGL
jgi:hypothetical protein